MLSLKLYFHLGLVIISKVLVIEMIIMEKVQNRHLIWKIHLTPKQNFSAYFSISFLFSVLSSQTFFFFFTKIASCYFEESIHSAVFGI